MGELDKTDTNEIAYASDGAQTWAELLKNTALYDPQKKQFILPQVERNFRQELEDYNQRDFFRTPMLDIPHKDDYGLMDINPFGLGVKPRFTPIEYSLPDSKIMVTGSGEYGMATIFDYDIVIYVVSHLARQMNEVKHRIQQGETNPRLPSRRMHVIASDMFKQLKIKDGGKQQKALLSKLRRLKGTNIEIMTKEGKRRRDGSFSLIGDFVIDSETKGGNVSEFILDIPAWIYDGVVKVKAPTVLTLQDKYMLLKSGYHKFLYRIARKSAGEDCWEWTIEELHLRSGSVQPLRKFKDDIKGAIDALVKDPFPDYHIYYKETGKARRGKITVHIENRTLPTNNN